MYIWMYMMTRVSERLQSLQVAHSLLRRQSKILSQQSAIDTSLVELG
jgi:hypothetical protein